MPNISNQEIKEVIVNGLNTQLMVKLADGIGQDLKNQNLTTSQIRSLFGEVRQIQGEWSMEGGRERALRRLILLKPKMAYRARKERGMAVKALVDILNPALDAVVDEKDTKQQSENFTRFVEFFEAILAYHKAYGGN